MSKNVLTNLIQKQNLVPLLLIALGGASILAIFITQLLTTIYLISILVIYLLSVYLVTNRVINNMGNQKDKTLRILWYLTILFTLTTTAFLVIENPYLINHRLEIVLVITTLLAILYNQKPKGSLKRNIKHTKNISLIILIIALACGTFFRFKDLGKDSFKDDEYQVIATAKGLIETKQFYRWSWLNDYENVEDIDINESNTYTRAPLHSLSVALSFKTFGVSEFSARLPSAVFGVFLILISYFIANFFFKNRLLSSVFALAIAFATRAHLISQYTRMYAPRYTRNSHLNTFHL